MRFFRGLLTFAGGLALTFLSAYGSSVFTTPKSDWYLALKKPTFTPNGLVFQIAWIIVYVLIAISVSMVINKKSIRPSLTLWIIELALNVLWCFAFFKLNYTVFALGILAVQLIGFIVLMSYYIKYTKELWIILIPVLAWYIFAFINNFAIVILN